MASPRRPTLPAEAFQYALLQVVPRLERGERINAGVILSCSDVDFLDARIELDERAVVALDATIDLDALRANLDAIPRMCRGGAELGPIGELPSRGRFRWLVAPRSTIIQPSPVHTGRTADPAACLERLMDKLVRRGR